MKNIFYFIFTALIISCNNDKDVNITYESNKLLDSTENTTDSVELAPTPLSTDSANSEVEISSDENHDFDYNFENIIGKYSHLNKFSLRPYDEAFIDTYYKYTTIDGEENYYCLAINDSTKLKFKLGYHDGTSNHLLKQDGTILESSGLYIEKIEVETIDMSNYYFGTEGRGYDENYEEIPFECEKYIITDEYYFNEYQQLTVLESGDHHVCTILGSTPESNFSLRIFVNGKSYSAQIETYDGGKPSVEEMGIRGQQEETRDDDLSVDDLYMAEFKKIYPYKYINIINEFLKNAENHKICNTDNNKKPITKSINKPIVKTINKPKEDLKNEVVVTAISDRKDTVNFYTFQDFLDNLSNNNTYYINVPKFNLSALNKSKSGKHFYWRCYIVDGGWFEDIYTSGEDFWGVSLVLKGLDNVNIVGMNLDNKNYYHNKTQILTYNPNSTVLVLDSSSNVNVSDFWIGHLQTQDACTSGVLAILNSSNITINDCFLYGTGTEGISIDKSENVFVNNTEIFDCSEYLGAAYGNNIKFKNCKFYNNGQTSGSSSGGCLSFSGENFSLENCLFEKNDCGGIRLYSGELEINNCVWRNNRKCRSLSNGEYGKLFYIGSGDNQLNISNCNFSNIEPNEFIEVDKKNNQTLDNLISIKNSFLNGELITEKIIK